MNTLAGKTALVTGASSGLGVDFARELARRGARLVLVARREDALQKLAAELRAAHGCEAVVIVADLATADAPRALYDQTKQRNLIVDVLVNNAGFGTYGLELDTSWDKTREMLILNMLALTQLTKLFGRDMAKRGFGRILQVASIGAHQPSPLYAAYSATKSYVRSFGIALNAELAGSGVSCTVLSPGATATEFLQVSGQKSNRFFNLLMMTSAEVAKTGIDAMLRGRSYVIAGFWNKLLMLLVWMTPDVINARMTQMLMKG